MSDSTLELAKQFADIVTPHISDNLQRMSGIVGLQRFHKSKKLVGTALTIKCRPGDNLYIYKALTQLQPGQVLVIDGAGNDSNALVGELIMLYAQAHGCAGFVIDGAIRDSAAFYEADFPCYARSVVHRGPYKLGPGALNVPVSVGGQVIESGDIIVGDEDGVVSFAPSQAPALLAAIAKTQAKEEGIKQEIATGNRDQAWLNAVLQSAGI
ncbi:RraA family protein [Lampropedia puyangensis]|uniref:Putative 4-hydroxy-4-methyl-2-oxoglutarate aldolase n=1 Tax=Lampropedia puyangensis TaxID=1330072 RepID=A0A4S8ENU7_9BURK|nr:RraA family protein [Lampropedia puyangensis]THT96399.1 RraA family protein [Lampropedia puyangensis]